MISDRAIRHDFEQYCRTVDRTEMIRAAEGLRAFHKPVLIVWGKDDRVMPIEHAARFVALLPDANLHTFEDCGTLVPLDQPSKLARAIRTFCQAPEAANGSVTTDRKHF